MVRKDNTVLYKGNRYSVPLGTYRPEVALKVTEQDGNLILSDLNSGKPVGGAQALWGKGSINPEQKPPSGPQRQGRGAIRSDPDTFGYHPLQ